MKAIAMGLMTGCIVFALLAVAATPSSSTLKITCMSDGSMKLDSEAKIP